MRRRVSRLAIFPNFELLFVQECVDDDLDEVLALAFLLVRDDLLELLDRDDDCWHTQASLWRAHLPSGPALPLHRVPALVVPVQPCAPVTAGEVTGGTGRMTEPTWYATA
jgi:hypothetical protein